MSVAHSAGRRARVAAACAALAACAGSARAQANAAALATPNDATPGTAKLLQADYAVPEVPALKMLDLDQSRLVRPYSARALATGFTSATGGSVYVPSGLGVEFSPLLLVYGRQLSIADYEAAPWKYRLRTSFAARRDSTTSRRTLLAGALRISLQDQSDLRTNRAFRRALTSLTRARRDSILLVREAWSRAGVPLVGDRTPAQDSLARAVEHGVGARLVTGYGIQLDSLDELVKAAKEEALWNADVFDVALGVRSSARDSLAGGMRFDGVAGWLTKGWAPRWLPGQFLVGTRGAYERDSTGRDLRGTGDAIARVYVGRNAYRVHADVQGTGRGSSRPSWLVGGGGEFRAATGFWVDLAANWRATGALGTGRLLHSVKLKFSPPG